MVFKAEIKEGKLNILSLNKYKDYLSQKEGKKILVELRDDSDIRSIAQNRFYWGIIIPEMVKQVNQNGHIAIDENTAQNIKVKVNKDNIHRFFGQMFLQREDEALGTTYIKSTAKLKVPEFQEYIKNCMDLVAINGGIITDKQWDTLLEYLEG